MHALWLTITALFMFYLGYRFYSKFLAEKIYRLDPNYKTPAHQLQDGIDFVPTNKYILWGHHFTSVAGASPILGPAIALYWGWLPALLWVVLGTIFFAGIHDFGALVLSIRNQGQSVGTLAGKYIGKRAKVLFLLIILFLLLMINAVFAWIISNLFISYPASVIAIFIQIPLAIWVGTVLYKRKKGVLLPSLIALFCMYLAVILASKIPFLQIDLVSYFQSLGAMTNINFHPVSASFATWIIILMVYVYIASTLPVWRLLQPRDYINSLQLVLGLLIIYIGVLIANPVITAPAINTSVKDVSWFPLLFITIACGAVSGFHSLVSSGTTSKQIDKETDARSVAYLAAVAEGVLALASILAVATYFKSTADFTATYSSFIAASASGLENFVNGAAQLANGLGIPLKIGSSLAAVIVISFAATTLDSSVRLLRYIIAELGITYDIKVITKRHFATSIAVVLSAALVFLPQGPYGFGSGGYLIWPLFGTTNQLLAGLCLLVLTIWLKTSGRNPLFAFFPMIFLFVVTIWALVQQVVTWSGLTGVNGNLLLLSLGTIILCLSLWIIFEAVTIFKKDIIKKT